MKKLIFLLIIGIILLSKTKAQDTSKYYILKKDTINIRGIVFNDLGKPASEVLLFFRGKTYPKPIKTDDQRKFEIKGASFNDTISVSYYTENLTITNKGSRYLEISLPSNRRNLTYNPWEISAKRKYPKKPIPTIKIPPIIGFPNYLQLAHFLGGDFEFETVIKSQIVYPEKAIENNIQGEVKIGFIVGKDGKLGNVEVIRGIGYGCEEQVINAIKKSPKWKPAIFMGNASAMPSSITINFKLTDK